jgi:hypothetical protein
MLVFLVQLAVIVAIAAASILILLEIAGVLEARTDPVGLWEGNPLYYFKIPMSTKTLILAGSVAAGLVILKLTDFDLCLFLPFWLPETRTGLSLGCR